MLHGLVVATEDDVAVASLDEREHLDLLRVEQGQGVGFRRRLGRQTDLDPLDARGEEGDGDAIGDGRMVLEPRADGLGQS